jgi:hypothetical protein
MRALIVSGRRRQRKRRAVTVTQRIPPHPQVNVLATILAAREA